MHLTTYSINKKNEDYIKNTGANGGNKEDGQEDDESEESASKWNLAQLARHFEKIGVNY